MIIYSDSTAGISLDVSFDMQGYTQKFTVRYSKGATKYDDFKKAANHLAVCIAQAEATAKETEQ